MIQDSDPPQLIQITRLMYIDEQNKLYTEEQSQILTDAITLRRRFLEIKLQQDQPFPDQN